MTSRAEEFTEADGVDKMLNTNQVIARKTENGYQILTADTGESVTRLNANVYPINSDYSSRIEHPEGIALSELDVIGLGIIID